MTRIGILLAIAAAGLATPAFTASALAAPDTTTVTGPGGVTLRSVTVDLPQSDREFPGADAAAVNNNCLTCHSAGMVLRQPPFRREKWAEIVNKMIQTYKAPIDAGDIPAIIDYLAQR
ncbi:sulfite dehydrogenase (cytochrome) subunit SorB [Nitrospirillum amazonense]|uniref:Sulfite dehydrogenase (Cytochrome) subunit SorB n=1 Tax=Nitrospirillum amazonense TaxID=28077 RepID=A0A560FGU5_9PROT|nr:cytochrome c [Nitrospirillum amazonense]TWB20820.1 sulfite dehydrogenase (cytochrome) subunit SorB [Nitrospirillum amazonense]